MGTFLIGNAWKLESLGVETSFETGSARVSAEISRMYRPVRKSARDARFAERLLQSLERAANFPLRSAKLSAYLEINRC